MGRKLSQEDLIAHKDLAIERLNNYLDDLIDDSDFKMQSKADKLSFWLNDWCTFLEFESNFSPSSLRRYKRGEVIKAHLGYNIGSEEGGLHYCVVIDVDNSRNSPIVTVIPLTSLKANTDITKLHKGSVYLGNELYTNLSSKETTIRKSLDTRFQKANEILDNSDNSSADLTYVENEIIEIKKQMALLEKIRSEISKMKIGSIALVSQMRTISKIRIYDPKTNNDMLSNVKLSNEKLDLLDNELKQIYTKIQ